MKGGSIVWLIPDVIYGIEILNDSDIIYKTEREYLNTINSMRVMDYE